MPGNHPDGLCAARFAPWQYGRSGRNAGPSGPLLSLCPRANYKIEDTWNSAGLIATGSNDVVLDNVFVPGHHPLEVKQSVNGKSPGGQFHQSFLYRLPLFAVFGYTLVGTALGGAQGALDFVADNLKARSSSSAQSNAPTNKQREQESVQVRVAELRRRFRRRVRCSRWIASASMKKAAPEIFRVMRSASPIA